ncbi:MAG: DUF4907 domain-containing protein [Chitinophagaceae bacterium]
MMKTMTNRPILSILLPLVLMAGCKTKTSPSHEGEVFVTIKTQQVPGGWGYKIYADTTLYINQPFIPVIGGKRPFQTENDARKTAELVVEKLKKGKEIPSIDSADLKRLGIINQ